MGQSEGARGGPSSGSQDHLHPVVSSDFKWAPRETSYKLPTVGLSLKPKLAQPGLGATQLSVANFSSPSSHVMGDPSAKANLTPLTHSTSTAGAFLDKPKSLMLTEVVADRQAEPPMVVQHRCLSGTSSNSLTVG